jgi:hypothetical protein
MLLGIGVQKGGTGTLFTYLSLFKFASRAITKELHFFDKLDFENVGLSAREEYLAKFESGGDVMIEVCVPSLCLCNCVHYLIMALITAMMSVFPIRSLSHPFTSRYSSWTLILQVTPRYFYNREAPSAMVRILGTTPTAARAPSVIFVC